MIPGPYSICRVDFPDADSESAVYTTLIWGYDTAKDAYAHMEQVAKDNGCERSDCIVIRDIGEEESDRFVD